MEDKWKKQLKEILKSEFLPLFIGLRDELKTLNTLSQRILEKELPEVQKTEVINPTEPLTEVGISNLPEVQKVEIINHAEQQKQIAISNLDTALEKHSERAKGFVETILAKFKELREGTMKVHIQNHQAFPKKIAISNLDEIVIPKAEPQSSIRISNSLPADAIPVVLTNRDRKNFYDAMQQMYVGNDVNMERVIKAIQEVAVNIEGDINVNTDYIEELLEATNTILNDILLAVQTNINDFVSDSMGEIVVPALSEVLLAQIYVSAGFGVTIKGFVGDGVDDGYFKLKVDSVPVAYARNSWTQRTVNINVFREVSEGETIFLYVENLRNQPRQFSGAVFGEQYTV